MNAIFQLVISTILLVQLSTPAFIPFRKLMNQEASNRRTITKRILSNYVDDYELPKEADSEVLRSTTCAYYDYKDACHNSNDGCGKRTVSCKPYLNSNPACYTAWSENEVLMQGCWLTSDRRDCTPGKCAADHDATISISPGEEFNFCCCYGDKCNEKYGLSNHIPSWP